MININSHVRNCILTIFFYLNKSSGITFQVKTITSYSNCSSIRKWIKLVKFQSNCISHINKLRKAAKKVGRKKKRKTNIAIRHQSSKAVAKLCNKNGHGHATAFIQTIWKRKEKGKRKRNRISKGWKKHVSKHQKLNDILSTTYQYDLPTHLPRITV